MMWDFDHMSLPFYWKKFASPEKTKQTKTKSLPKEKKKNSQDGK